MNEVQAKMHELITSAVRVGLGFSLVGMIGVHNPKTGAQGLCGRQRLRCILQHYTLHQATLLCCLQLHQ